jgi:hypothetical protein
VVAIDDGHRNGRPERLAVSNATDELDPIRFDLHPTAAAVATLPAGKMLVDVLGKERQARRNAFDDRNEPWAVGLSRGEPAKA